MLEFISPFVSSFGYLAVFIVMLANSDFLPLFTETTLPLAGFLASQGRLSLEFIILASVLGDFVGAVIAYYVGFYLQKRVILSFIRKYGKYVLLKEDDYVKAIKLLRKHGPPIVFILKLTPGLKTYTSVAAGISRINIYKYAFASVSASVIYNSICTYAGFYLGKNWTKIIPVVERFQLIIFLSAIIAVFIFINHRLKIVRFEK